MALLCNACLALSLFQIFIWAAAGLFTAMLLVFGKGCRAAGSSLAEKREKPPRPTALLPITSQHFRCNPCRTVWPTVSLLFITVYTPCCSPISLSSFHQIKTHFYVSSINSNFIKWNDLLLLARGAAI